MAGVALTRLARLSHAQQTPPEAAHQEELAQLRQQMQRNQQKLARLQQRLTAVEEELSETRRIGLQVAHLGDIVTALLARNAAESDPSFAEDLARYADDL
jgi:uncharacterized protein involved in propanediol utilization